MGSSLTPFPNQQPESIVEETFVGMFSNGWTDLGGGILGANGEFALFDFGVNIPEARAEKNFTGFVPNTLNAVTVNMSWTNASAGDPTVYSFGVWVNDEYQTLPSPGWLGGTAADLTFIAQADGAGEINVKVGGINFLGSINVIGAFNAVSASTIASVFSDIIIDSAQLIVSGRQLSVTRGGLTFEPGEEWEEYPFPGKTMNTRGCRELVRCKPVIRGNVMMTGETELSAYRPGATWSPHATIPGGRTFTPNALRSVLASGGYLERVLCVWKRQRNDYLAVEFPCAIAASYGIGATDADEGVLPLEIEAVQDLATGTTKTAVPYLIHILPADTTTGDL